MRPRIATYRTRVWQAAPQAVAIVTGLARRDVAGISGHTGTRRYGYPSQQTQRTKYAGYVNPPQMFIGYTAKRVAAGAIRATPPAIPTSTQPWSVTGSPLMQAMATVSAGQLQKRGHG
jgi:hypothetical protein